MNLDASTFVMSLSLDALLCCGISAALTRVLPQSADALWNWSGAMLCYAVGFALIEAAGQPGTHNPVLTGLLPHCFGLVGSASALHACYAINGQRIPRWPLICAALACAALGASFYLPSSPQEREGFALLASSFMLLIASGRFASESRWRSGFGGWLAIVSIGAMAAISAAIGLLSALGASGAGQAMAPFLFLFEAALLCACFAFVLAAGEIARSQAMELSMRDGLTGMLTKRAFHEAASPAISKAKRERLPCAMLMIDIDFFKRVNDTHGHLAGDAAIAHASDIIRRALRASDICARFGGEEFCALLPNTDSSGARQVADRILALARSEPTLHTDVNTGALMEIPCTVSIGVHVALLADGSGATLMLAKADEALLASKKNGRDRLTLTEAAAK